MRKTFYDLLDEVEFDVYKEYEKLLFLFTKEKSTNMQGYLYPLSDYIEEHYFRGFKYRGSFTSLYEMMRALRIDNASSELEQLFVFCEFLIAIMPKDKWGHYTQKQSQVIRGNIDNILEKTNHQLIQAPGARDKCIIVEKNKGAMLAAEIVGDKEISFELLEYNHYALKGNLTAKRKILSAIGVYMEPMLRDNELSNAGYKELESNVGFLLNKFHIRHNNKEGKTAQDYIVSIDDTVLEEWYDRAYDVMIQAIITRENIKVEKDIIQLKANYKWR